MEIQENVTIYKCGFCKKKMFRKHAMVNHEVKCSLNPLNNRACFDCENLKRVDINYSVERYCVEHYYNQEQEVKSSCFFCKAKEIFMFPPKVEHSNRCLPDAVYHKGVEIEQESMPIKCDDYVSEYDFFNF